MSLFSEVKNIPLHQLALIEMKRNHREKRFFLDFTKRSA